MKRIGIFFGGRSGEHEISCLSAVNVISVLDPEKYSILCIGITKDGKWMDYDGPVENIADGTWEEMATPMSFDTLKSRIDFALPILHGTYGEDGTIQGFFEMMDIPYGGAGVLGSAACMDKVIAKQVFIEAGVPTCAYLLFNAGERFENIANAVKEGFGYPCFVKPANCGSSVGITKARDEEQLQMAIAEAAQYDRRIIIEESIEGREVETAVLGNENPAVAAVGEIISEMDFYDYKAKYSDDVGTRIIVPADLSEDVREEIRTCARKAYMAIDCAGFARCDFFVEKGTDRVLINEINTIPGFTKYSMFPLLWEAAGLTCAETIERIIEAGYERYTVKNNRKTVR